jgi:serine/threonine-protein kinase
VWRDKKEYAQAIADWEEALRRDPKDPDALDGLGWIRATCPDAKSRNGPKALELAKTACDLTGWKHANCLDTLATAHAEQGDFPEAVKWQSKAIELADDETEQDDYRRWLELYEGKKPYRESNP